MSLKLTVDALDDVPENLRSLYAESDGKFRLDVEGVEDTAGLKSALQKERDAHRKAAAEKKAFESLGLSPDEIQAMLSDKRKTDEDRMKKSGDFDKILAQVNDKNEKEKGELTSKVKALTAHLESELIDARATSAIAAAKGEPALLLPHVRAFARVVEEAGAYKVVVVGRDGTPRVDGKGNPLSIVDLVSEMRQDAIYGRAFEATGTTGGGMQPSGAPRPGNAELMKLSPVERMNAARAKRT